MRTRLVIFIVIMIFVVFTLVCLFVPITYVTGKGEHTGIITAVETTGIIFKVHTIYFKSSDESTQEETYCVTNEKLLPQLYEAQEEKRQVTLEWIDYLSIPINWCKVSPIVSDFKSVIGEGK